MPRDRDGGHGERGGAKADVFPVRYHVLERAERALLLDQMRYAAEIQIGGFGNGLGGSNVDFICSLRLCLCILWPCSSGRVFGGVVLVQGEGDLKKGGSEI